MENKNLINSLIPLGMIFGSAIGVVIGLMIGIFTGRIWLITFSIPIGAGIGLLIGSVAYGVYRPKE